MNFYIILGKSKYPITNRLFTEKDIEEIKQQPEAIDWSFVPIEIPWANTEWARNGGRGKSPYKRELTTIRVEKIIAYEVQKYAVWLSQQEN